MTFALGAGDLFKLDKEGEFEETIISKCIDTYITVSVAKHSAPQESAKAGSLPTLATSFTAGTDDAATAAALTSPTTPFSQTTLPSKSLLSRASTDNFIQAPGAEGKTGGTPDHATQSALDRVIERLFESCLREGRYRQVVGIAVEARNLEVLRRVIKRASSDSRSKQVEGVPGPSEELMEYVLGICMDVVQERALRTEILRLILDLLNEIPTPDYFSIAKCAVYLDQDEQASEMLQKLSVCFLLVTSSLS
jgi:26S proteasome regulatory subunit N2